MDEAEQDLIGRRGRQLRSHRSLLFGHFHMCPEGCVFDENYSSHKDRRHRRRH